MNFTWLNKQGVRSDTGFEFQFTGRFTAEYREGERTLKLYVDGGTAITIYEGDLECLWLWISDPFARKRRRDQIIKNIREALAFQNLGLDWQTGRAPTGPV